MVALVLLLIAYSLIFGRVDFAKGLVRPFFGLVIVATVLPPLIESCTVTSRRGHSSAPPIGAIFLVLLLAGLGYLLWQRRAERQRSNEAWRRRHGQARRRVLPPPPLQDEDQAPAHQEEQH